MDINEVLNSENPSKYLYWYARNHGRLSPKWERLFLEFKNMYYITWYARDIIKGRWLEAEPILLESGDIEEICYYAAYVIQGRWPEAEPILLESKNTHGLYYYAKWVWPEAEKIIQQDKKEWDIYCKHFNIKE